MPDLLFEVNNEIATITLNRPEALNAFSGEMLDLWIDSLEKVRDSDEISVLIVQGAGNGFCSGGDIKEMIAGNGFYKSDQDNVSKGINRKNSLWKKVQRIPLLLEEIDKPVIAKVHGAAFGAGLDMALMCDIRFASESARLSESYIKVGIVPGDGGAYFLPRLVGRDMALHMLWTGEVLTAEAAKERGLVTFVVPDEKLDQAVADYAKGLANGPQLATQLIKRAVYQNSEMSLRSSLDYISSKMALVMEEEDHKEGVQAVMEKRKPNFGKNETSIK
ncbi:enoyl-CoA hydratase [Bacillus sp. FJAT-27231]|uniref:enoyl-CoA hydratase/isomerase family protein n=1 Tax=Bacillus sp. FJAT-27231 TaxID=1679168 RepID=UPI000670B9B1|nr:enoyl-CoA hydratase-related protein [Bacillus sp. FJAT-27231]KMY54048.1 enoyl-CoA hydratase [Bacillus sp. FJAT-27231]